MGNACYCWIDGCVSWLVCGLDFVLLLFVERFWVVCFMLILVRLVEHNCVVFGLARLCTDLFCLGC